MLIKVLLGLLTVAGAAAVLVFILRQKFLSQLDGFEAQLRNGASPMLRTDLPPEVLALAERLGARREAPSRFVSFDQTGTMWQTPGGREMPFTASQTIATDVAGFVWRASFSPAGYMLVADYFVCGRGGLDARLLGAIRMAGESGTEAVNQGEALRYLIELPWNPDAILVNASLEWTVMDPATIKVATGKGAERGEVTFRLDSDGLVREASAPSRAGIVDGKQVTRPWQGRFWDYMEVAGRRVPRHGEVAWVLDGREFVYWRGEIRNWAAK